MKKILIALAIVGLAGSAYAQNAPMTPGATNAPPGTSYSGTGSGALPSSTTGTPRAGALDSTNVTSAEAATREQLKQAGFTDVKGLSRTPDGVWSGRAVKSGIEVAVSIDAAGKITTQ